MNEKIYVFGHRSPDTDSICSSIAYSTFKQLKGYQNIRPYRLGNLNKETEFVLNYFNVPTPDLLLELKPKVQDLALYRPRKINGKDPIEKVWYNMTSVPHNRLIPILDENNKVRGIVTVGDITKLFMEQTDENIAVNHEIIFENLSNILELHKIKGNYKYKTVEGRIIIGSISNLESPVTDKDIIITTRIEHAEEQALLNQAGCIILTNGTKIDDTINTKCALMYTNHNLYRVVGNINRSISIDSIMNIESLQLFYSNNKIEDIIDIIKESSHRNFLVVNPDDTFCGVLSRRHFIDKVQKNVILIDHNEQGQSVEGVQDANILEIIDHHRIADVQTDSPLFIRSEPVGCTSTIIHKIYRENNVPIPKNIAGIMLSAILSDTLMFTSPTCTCEDKNAAENLAEIAGVDINNYGREMFEAATSLKGATPKSLLETDCKRFRFGKNVVYIAQINTLDIKSIYDMKDELIEELDNFCISKNCDLIVFMITDIHIGGTEILARGNRIDIARKAFGISKDEYTIFLPGVVSRKKQIVPLLAKY